MPRELTPQTRRNLWLIAIFFLIDGAVALGVAAWADAGKGIALGALVWGLGNIALGFVPIFCVLVATKYIKEKSDGPVGRQEKRQ